MGVNKKRCLAGLAAAVIYAVGVWASGWEPERGAWAVFILAYFLAFVGWATAFPFSD